MSYCVKDNLSGCLQNAQGKCALLNQSNKQWNNRKVQRQTRISWASLYTSISLWLPVCCKAEKNIKGKRKGEGDWSPACLENGNTYCTHLLLPIWSTLASFAESMNEQIWELWFMYLYFGVQSFPLFMNEYFSFCSVIKTSHITLQSILHIFIITSFIFIITLYI